MLTLKHLVRWARLLAIAAAAATCAPLALAHDYPTSDRVVFVQDCIRDHPGPHYEMINKCSCALDKIAGQIKYDDYVTMDTATNANSIGGERGSYIRDTESLQKLIRQYRTVKADALKACFVGVSSPTN